MDTTPRLSIIAVCIDSLAPIFKRFLSSIRQYTSITYELIIIDNAGKSKSTSQMLHDEADVYIKPQVRLSVAEAWNMGIKESRGEYVLVTNDDVIVPENWFGFMQESFAIFSNVGLVAPVMNYGLMEQTHIGTIWQKELASPQLLTPFKQIIWGVFMLFKRSALDDVGLFSEEFKVAGGEDLDMIFKLYDKGYNVVVDHRIFVYHEWGSTGKRLYGHPRRKEIYDKNYRKFKKKWARHTKNWT